MWNEREGETERELQITSLRKVTRQPSAREGKSAVRAREPSREGENERDSE